MHDIDMAVRNTPGEARFGISQETPKQAQQHTSTREVSRPAALAKVDTPQKPAIVAQTERPATAEPTSVTIEYDSLVVADAAIRPPAPSTTEQSSILLLTDEATSGPVEAPQEEIELAHMAPLEQTVYWSDELAKEPLDIYRDFITTLQSLTEIRPPIDMATMPVTHDLHPEGGIEIPENMPPIIGVVAERLATLEPSDQEYVAEVLRNIVGGIHGLRLLEASEAAPEATTAVRIEVKRLCTTLLETLGIDYEEPELQQFIALLLNPDFRLMQSSPELSLDLEHMGTREVKYRSTGLHGNVASMGLRLEHLLGMFAVLSVSQFET